MNAWCIAGALGVGLLVILASLSGFLPIALPLAMVIGLGLPAALCLWEHREKLEDIFGARQNH